MPENSKSNVKKVFLPVLVLTTSFYYSYLLAAGLVLGYLGCRLYHKKFVESGKVGLIFIDCGKWKIHFHHWMMGALILLIVWVVDYFYLPSFFVGVIAGVITHDIYDFNDWHRVVVRKENVK